MQFNKFLKDRHSVRDYKDKKVDQDTLKRLMYFADEIQESYGNDKVRFILFEDGKDVFSKLEDIAGYSGIMIESPHYIGLQLDDEDKETIIRGAYCMESLITKAFQLELGTCWINLINVSHEVKKSFTTGENKHIDYLIAFGYPQERKPFNPEPTSSRLSVEEIVYSEEWGNSIDIDTLDRRGLSNIFYYVRFVPSDKNRQPWRFIVKNDSVLLGVMDPEKKENLIDAGIMKYYFEQIVHDYGIIGQWDDVSIETKKHEKIQYSIVGKFNI